MFCNQLVNRRSRRMVKSLSALLTVGVIAFGTHAVHAQSIADGNYTITNACNGKSLGLQNGNPDPWDNAMLRDSGTTWQVASAGDGTTILRASGTQSALQTSYAKTTSETDVDLWTYGGGASQRWIIGDGGNGTFKLALAAAPGMALDAKYGGANGEAEVWLYAENNTCAQRWNIKPAAGGGGNNDDAFAMQKKLGRGINFGNILEASPVDGVFHSRRNCLTKPGRQDFPRYVCLYAGAIVHKRARRTPSTIPSFSAWITPSMPPFRAV
jgi:hypothetical protein